MNEKKIDCIIDGLAFLIRNAEEKSIGDMMFKKLWIKHAEQLINPKKDKPLSEETKDTLLERSE